MFVKASRSGKHVYLRLVEAFRDDAGRTHHRQIAQIGRVDDLRRADATGASGAAAGSRGTSA